MSTPAPCDGLLIGGSPLVQPSPTRWCARATRSCCSKKTAARAFISANRCGESLLPRNVALLDRLGVRERPASLLKL